MTVFQSLLSILEHHYKEKHLSNLVVFKTVS